MLGARLMTARANAQPTKPPRSPASRRLSEWSPTLSSRRLAGHQPNTVIGKVMMPATGRSSAYDRWRDVEGNHISLFSRVEQVKESLQPRVLPSRLHQRPCWATTDSFWATAS